MWELSPLNKAAASYWRYKRLFFKSPVQTGDKAEVIPPAHSFCGPAFIRLVAT